MALARTAGHHGGLGQALRRVATRRGAVFFSVTCFSVTFLLVNQASIARLICSLSGTPSRSLTVLRPIACSGSIQNEYSFRCRGLTPYI